MNKRDITPGVVPYAGLQDRETRNPIPADQAGEGNSDMPNDIDLFAFNPHVSFHINSVINSYTVHFMVDTGTAVLLLGTDTCKKNFYINSLDKSRVGWGNPTQSQWYS